MFFKLEPCCAALAWVMLSSVVQAADSAPPAAPLEMTAPPESQAIAQPAETVDSYAKRLLQHRATQPSEDAVGTNAPAISMQYTSPDMHVLFISSAGTRRSAYLVLDGTFGKTVSAHDSVGGWSVQTIGADYVDLDRKGEQRRLLLPARGLGKPSPVLQDD
ncbi:MAG: hypothetical protein JHC61_06200 [Burkholderiaceae bacterium]|nr:hypothetical protein [Burkholderiaceae bacterium]